MRILGWILIGLAWMGARAEAQRAMWTAEVAGGGQFTVPLDAVTSVSVHRFVADQALEVTEMTVGTAGSITARFYHVAPFQESAMAQELGDEVKNTTGVHPKEVVETVKRMADSIKPGLGDPEKSPLWERVTKHYPATTHARTVEYRLKEAKAAQDLYDSLMAALEANRSETIAR